MQGAMFDVAAEDNVRGQKFFIGSGKGDETLESYGYNYVKVCTELIKVLAVIKPKKLFYSE
jgi:hypothetical protein